MLKCQRYNIDKVLNLNFCPPPKNPPCIPPAPSCTAKCEFWRKEISRGFANPFPQNCFAKPSPHCIRASVLFLWEKLRASHRGASAQRMHDISSLITFWILLEIHSNFVQ